MSLKDEIDAKSAICNQADLRDFEFIRGLHYLFIGQH